MSVCFNNAISGTLGALMSMLSIETLRLTENYILPVIAHGGEWTQPAVLSVLALSVSGVGYVGLKMISKYHDPEDGESSFKRSATIIASYYSWIVPRTNAGAIGLVLGSLAAGPIIGLGNKIFRVAQRRRIFERIFVDRLFTITATDHITTAFRAANLRMEEV